MQKNHSTKLNPLINKTVLKIQINVGVNGKKGLLFSCFVGVMDVWKRFKIRVKIMEIKRAGIKAAFNERRGK